MTKPTIITIAGSSGVGKTTTSKIFSIILGVDNCTILHGDDLHKYVRNDEKWKEFTHLNPEANNLALGDEHLSALYSLGTIKRKVYNHKTGLFNEAIDISPNKYIIEDGLHSLYTKTYLELSNLKIYIDAPFELTCHWKIIRDIKERGQTLEQVKDTIERRKLDFEKYIKPQKNNCDVIIKFKLISPIKKIGDPDEVIEIDVEYIIVNEIDTKLKDIFDHMFSHLKEYTHKINGLTICCQDIRNL